MRCFSSGDEERCPARILTATVRSNRVSSARYTSPIPPAPSGDWISYGPSFVPAVRAIRVAQLYTADRHRPFLNLPIPNLTSTVLTPGLGLVSPAFEMCRYRASSDSAWLAPRKCTPNAAADVKFTFEVPGGTSCEVKSVPPFNSRYGAMWPRVAKFHFSPTGFTPAP